MAKLSLIHEQNVLCKLLLSLQPPTKIVYGWHNLLVNTVALSRCGRG